MQDAKQEHTMAPEAAKADNNGNTDYSNAVDLDDLMDPIIEKVPDLEDFKKSCDQYNELSKASEEKEAELKEVKEQIDKFFSKHMDEGSSKTKEEKLEMLLAMERHLSNDFYKKDGADFFTMLFKSTYYGEKTLYSVCNNNARDRDDLMFTPCECEDYDTVEKKVEKIEVIESKINYVINNILMKMIENYEDKYMMQICLAEQYYSMDSMLESSKRIAKVVLYWT